ncbi:hypothetical protein ES703_121775 [subsurface metagenome]
MKRRAWKTFVLAAGTVVIMLIAGCEKENAPDTKRSRLIATENIRLKKELEQRDKEIKKQEKLLEKCLQERDTWKAKAQQNIQEQVDSILTVVMEKNKELREENEGLKVQIKELKAELEEAKK